MDRSVADLLEHRRKQTLGAVLNAFDREAAPYLPEEVSRRIRRIARGQMHEYHQFVLDILDDHVIVNELYLQKLAELEEAAAGG